MKLRKVRALTCLGLVCLLINTGIDITKPLFEDNNEYNCPEYINDFVAKNPQAISLAKNYQEQENTEPITLDAPNGIPLYMQWDKRWAYSKYGEEIIGTAGCGPTCLSMVAVGLTKNTDYNPRFVAKYAINHNYLEGSKTRWALMSNGCQAFNLIAKNVPLNKNAMINELNADHPIIASVRPGDFTSTGHFIVITKTIDSKFIVNDPNSKENSHRKWSYQRLAPQIKAMWAFSSN